MSTYRKDKKHWYGTLPATVPSRLDGGAIKTVSVSVIRLVLTPTLTLNDPLCPNFTTQHNYTGFNPNS